MCKLFGGFVIPYPVEHEYSSIVTIDQGRFECENNWRNIKNVLLLGPGERIKVDKILSSQYCPHDTIEETTLSSCSLVNSG